MRVLVSGASGMIGSAIVDALRERGDEVGALVRDAQPKGTFDVAWDPERGTIDETHLDELGFDGVVHLAGEPLIGRWTDAKRQRIRDSRVNGTALLARSLAVLARPPAVFACASAVGWYGDRGNELLTEEAARGHGFLAGVVGEWEAAADAARDARIRTVHMRMGAVQSGTGGALGKQLLPFRLGVGGPIGNGRQWWAWVGLHDVVRMWLFALDDERMVGPINAEGPTPCTNREYARALGRVLHRPAVLPVPPVALRLAMGDLVEEMLLVSQKVVPARLEALGFDFHDRTIEDALRRELAQ